MPVERYRSVEEMPPPPRRDPRDPATWVAIRELWALAEATLPRLYPPGVTRFRSIEEAQQAREEATIERMRKVRRARESVGKSAKR
jgi:hypothetical protein